jgi:hypothetical protein
MCYILSEYGGGGGWILTWECERSPSEAKKETSTGSAIGAELTREPPKQVSKKRIPGKLKSRSPFLKFASEHLSAARTGPCHQQSEEPQLLPSFPREAQLELTPGADARPTRQFSRQGGAEALLLDGWLVGSPGPCPAGVKLIPCAFSHLPDSPESAHATLVSSREKVHQSHAEDHRTSSPARGFAIKNRADTSVSDSVQHMRIFTGSI